MSWINWKRDSFFCRFCGEQILNYPCVYCNMGKPRQKEVKKWLQKKS